MPVQDISLYIFSDEGSFLIHGIQPLMSDPLKCLVIDILCTPPAATAANIAAPKAQSVPSDHGWACPARPPASASRRAPLLIPDGIDRIMRSPTLHAPQYKGTEGGGFHQRTEYFRGAGTSVSPATAPFTFWSASGMVFRSSSPGRQHCPRRVPCPVTSRAVFSHQHAVQNFVYSLRGYLSVSMPASSWNPGVDVSESRLPG